MEELSDGGVLRGRHIHNEKGGVWELKQWCLRATRARASKILSGFSGNTPAAPTQKVVGTAYVSYLKEDKPFVHLSEDKNHSPRLRIRESPQSFI